MNKKDIIHSVMSAWVGHYDFAQWLVFNKQPKVIVDLGVDYGFSTYAFAVQNIGMVYAIDNFNGEEQTGVRDTEYFVRNKIKQLDLKNVCVFKCYFDEIAKIWGKQIDILHIDGYHSYEAVKNDYETWINFLAPDGVVLFHDTKVFKDDFGVYKFFDELDIPKINFKQSYGLGVASMNKSLINRIKIEFANQID